MKLANYDKRTLILNNLRTTPSCNNTTYTKAQYYILCRLIRQKKITESFFNLLLSSLYNTTNWKKLTYKQMYELIHVLTFYNYEKVRNINE